MTPILLAGPASEPLSVDEMRLWLKLETHEDDALITAMIKAARSAVEQAIRRALLAQKWRLRLPQWPAEGEVRLPLSPILSIDAVRGFDAAGASLPMNLGNFCWAGQALWLRAGSSASDQLAFGAEIDVTIGYGARASDVPDTLLQGMRLLIGHWYAHRTDALHDSNVTHFPAAVAGLIMPYRSLRLR